MSEPLHDLRHAFDPQPLGHLRSPDHDDGQTKLAGGLDLGARALPARVARHNPFDLPRAHHLQFTGKCEGSARDDEIGISQRQRTVSNIDEAERIGVLRFASERRDMLPADGEENIRTRPRQRGHGGRDIIHIDPDVVSGPDPRLALQREQRRCRRRAGGKRITADLGCEGMGCIDHMREFFLPNEIGKAVRPAEAADTGRQRLIDRNLCSSGIGIDRVEAHGRGFSRQPIGFARSAQDENAHG